MTWWSGLQLVGLLKFPPDYIVNGINFIDSALPLNWFEYSRATEIRCLENFYGDTSQIKTMS